MDDSDAAGFGALFVLLLISAVLGFIPAMIAQSKGRELAPWWIYGTLLFIFALVHSLLLTPTEKTVEQRAVSAGNLKCPHCAEWIKREAKVCRFCGRDVDLFDGPALGRPL